MRVLPFAMAALTLAATPARATRDEYDAAMLREATNSGCMACHSILPAPRRADGLPPIAPAWRDVAIKYRDDPGASDRLTRTVMSGSNPSSRHWAGKVSDVTMPPNSAVVTEAEARILVNWILVLVP
jgi:cytochrome c